MHVSIPHMIAVVAVAAIAAACLVPSAIPAHAQAAGSPPVPAGFVEPGTDPQTYVDRYLAEPSYKEWFDNNYSEYDSIYHAVGLSDPNAAPEPAPPPFARDAAALAPFVDPAVDPITYVERYLTDPSYKEWYDANYLAEYGSIYDAVGIPDPDVFMDEPEPPQPARDLSALAPFVDPAVDPNTYVDRYHTEPSYKEWFDTNYPQYDSIYHAVGLPDPAGGSGGGVPAEPELPPPVVAPGVELPPGLELKPGQEYGECGEGTELANGYCVIIGTEPPPSPATSTAGPDAAGSDDERGGGCLIATAAYGSEMAPQVQLLREIRDGRLAQTQAGSSFVEGFNVVYYSFSPHVADYERENPVFRDMVRTLLTPMLYTLGIMDHAGSESEVLAYGIAALLAILMIYVGAPVLAASYMHRYYARCREDGAVAHGSDRRESC